MTIAAFYNALAALVVSGVARRFTYEPNGVNTADLPAQWIRLPRAAAGSDSAFASACVDTSKERVAELVIVTEAAGQDTPGPATAALLAIMDNVETALDGWAAQPPFMDYTQEAGQVVVGGVAYWAAIATVTGRG